MSSGDGCTGTDRPAWLSAGAVPPGWERKVEGGSVCYISPSGAVLTSLEQICAYLLAEGTCKCGLECPLDVHKVFNFDPGVAVAGRGSPGAQDQQDMTKLCNHRRKTAAMATLYRSVGGAPGPCRSGTGPGLSPLFSAEGHLAVAPSTGVPPPSTVGSLPRVPLGVKTLEAASAPTGTWLIAPPFLQPHDIVPGANTSPKNPPPASPCFGLRLPPPDAVTPPTSPVVASAEGTRSQRPAGRTSSWAGATGESPELGGQGPGLLAPTSAPQAGKGDPPVSDALTSPSSHNPPVPLDAVPEGRGFLGLPPVSPPFPASSLLSLAAKAQLGSPNPAAPPSTLSPCPLPPGTLLALLGKQAPGRGARWPRRPDPQDPAAHRVSPATGQPLAALLSLLGARGCPGGGGLGDPSLPPAPLPPADGSPCPGTGLLPTGRDFSGQLRGLFGQLVASSDPPSGTSPRSKASGRDGGPGNRPALSPLLPNQPLLPPCLPPLGLSLGQGSPPGTASPPASPLQSLQLGPRLGPPEKAATPLGPSAGGSPSPPAPPGLPEGTPSALEPLVPCRAEPGSSRPCGGAQGCPTSQPPLKWGRRQAEGLNRETPSLCGPPSTQTPRCGASQGGWRTRQRFNRGVGDRGEKGLPPATPPFPRPPWRCNRDIPAAEQQLGVEEIKGNSLHLRRGWRRKASTPRLSTRLETLHWGALSTSPTAGLSVAQHPWPGSPKNHRRKLLM